MNHVPRETVEAAAALVKAGKVRVNVAQVPQKLYIEVIAKGGGHTGRAIVRDLHTNVVLVEQDGEPPSTSGTRTLPPQATAMWSPRSRSRPS